MEIEGESLDDILICLYKKLLHLGRRNTGTRGDTIELLGVALRIQNARARLSRSENRGKPFSAFGELLWYISGKDDLSFIEEYVPAYKNESERNGTIHGAYGPRIFNMRGEIDQINSVIDLLGKRSSSRRAVIQLFNAEDIASEHKEVPCTTTMQFFRREGQLHMATTMRSNDAYKGLPHDVFCFTMIQEMIASKLRINIGEYYHYAGSMHCYVNDKKSIEEYSEEGYHRLSEMPAMPHGDPFAAMSKILECERRMRNGEYVIASEIFEENYWADLLRLLQAFWASGMDERLDEIASQFKHPIYRTYLETRRTMRCRRRDDQQLG